VTGFAFAQVDAAAGPVGMLDSRFGCSGIGHELASVIASGAASLIAVVLLLDRVRAARRS
jgi:hypothetical protein